MSNEVRVLVAIPNAYWTGLNSLCFMASTQDCALYARCVKEPEENQSYENEILEVSHTNIKQGVTTVLGEFTGSFFRDQFMREHWEGIQASGLRKEVIEKVLN